MNINICSRERFEHVFPVPVLMQFYNDRLLATEACSVDFFFFSRKHSLLSLVADRLFLFSSTFYIGLFRFCTTVYRVRFVFDG